ncbi:MAG TPA: phosphodiester glycosidase family protein [Bacillota bacterium]|nr:phosphodiester glycosidase family protein [Bacillota bacterium]
MLKKSKILRRLIIILFYLGISTGAIVLYGPFENIRKMVIGSVLTSSHPWYIEPFYSEETLAKYRPVSYTSMEEATMEGRDFSGIHDDQIDVVSIDTKKYSGKMIVVHDPKRVHVAITKELGTVGQTVSEMVKDAKAIAGINAGGFDDSRGRGTGGVPMGLVISHGKYIFGDKDEEGPMIALSKDGALTIGSFNYQQLQNMGVQEAVSFGPLLVKNGQSFLKPSDDTWGIAPRSAIGQREDGAIVLLALSGRGNGGIGATLMDCANEMIKNGAVMAANLDGGYSTELYYKNDFLVTPSNPMGERYVPTSFVVAGGNQ